METNVINEAASVERYNRLPSRMALIGAVIMLAVVIIFELVNMALDSDSAVAQTLISIISLGAMALSFSVLARWFSLRADSWAGLGLVLMLAWYAVECGVGIGGAFVMSRWESVETYADVIDVALFVDYFFSLGKWAVIIGGLVNVVALLLIATALWRLYKARGGGYMALSIFAYVATLANFIFAIMSTLNETIDDVVGAETAGFLLDMLFVYPLLIAIASVGASKLNSTTIPESELNAPVVAPTRSLVRYFATAVAMAIIGLILGMLSDIAWWGVILIIIVALVVLIMIGAFTDDEEEESDDESETTDEETN